MKIVDGVTYAINYWAEYSKKGKNPREQLKRDVVRAVRLCLPTVSLFLVDGFSSPLFFFFLEYIVANTPVALELSLKCRPHL